MKLNVAAALVDGVLVPGDVEVDGDRITRVGVAGAGRGIAVPGFVDLQVNGFGGVDFLDASVEDYATAGEALAATGVTAYQPTLITSPPDTVVTALRTLTAARERTGPHILGAHLEGPFLSPEKPGTHPVEHLRTPDPDLLDRLLDAGPVTMVTLAPELPGALDLVRRLVDRGVLVSCGHTAADADAAAAAFDAGARALTHLFNAMRPFVPRNPGIAGVALTRDDVTPGVIVDGVHLAPATVQLAWRATGGQLVLVTDAIAAAGRGEGTWRLGSVTVEVRGNEARRADGTLAGSVLTMDAAVRNLVDLGVSVEQAVGAATATPAGLVGRDDLGDLRVGGPADVVVLDDDLAVQRTLVGGQDLR